MWNEDRIASCLSRRRLTIATIGLRFLLMGFEYAIILPTLNQFLQSMHGNVIKNDGCEAGYSLDLGLALSAMSFTSLISAPIFGRIGDITRTTKLSVLVGNLFEIGGNIMYCFSQSPSVLIVSRLVVGIGVGPSSSIIGMVARATPQKERTSVISIIFSLRQTGVVIGPACNFFLSTSFFNFWIGPFHIDENTSPALFLFVLWTLHTAMTIFLYFDLPPVEDSPVEDNSTYGSTNNDISDDYEPTDEGVQKKSPTTFFQSIRKDLLTEEVVACLSTAFIAIFTLTGFEALVTPLTCQLFDWRELENSVFYLGSGVLYVVGLVALGKLSSKYTDEQLVIFGLVSMLFTHVLFLFFSIYAVNQPHGATWALVWFALYGAFMSLFFPFTFTPMVSLISKLTSEGNQGFSQGIQMLMTRVGQIMGPIWTTSLVAFSIPALASVNLCVLFVPTVMFVVSYKQFEKRRLFIENSRNFSEESSPLLSQQGVQDAGRHLDQISAD